VDESPVSTRRTLVFVIGMLALFVVGLVAAKAWLPGPVRVTEPCRAAFERPAIETDENAMVAAVAACRSWAEFTKAARDELDMDATEFEEFRRTACRAGSAANLVRPCLSVA
jgi:hypothetical protein